LGREREVALTLTLSQRERGFVGHGEEICWSCLKETFEAFFF